MSETWQSGQSHAESGKVPESLENFEKGKGGIFRLEQRCRRDIDRMIEKDDKRKSRRRHRDEHRGDRCFRDAREEK
jgi:hypothetical protein